MGPATALSQYIPVVGKVKTKREQPFVGDALERILEYSRRMD